jgi:hypothetical protein
MTDYDQIADILETAADVIERDGHAKRTMENEIGQKCATGAINVAITGEAHYFNWLLGGQACKIVCEALELAVNRADSLPSDGVVNTVVDWNNKPSTTAQEVIDGLRKSAKLALRKADGND